MEKLSFLSHSFCIDEMICLLQEKLEDPENYSTVVDENPTNANNATLYMDPLNLNKS